MGKGRRARRTDAAVLDRRAARAAAHVRGAAPPDTPLIAHLVTGEALHPDVVGRLFKATFARAAELLAITNPNVAADLRRASALVAPHLCESRSGRRRRHPRHGGIARPRESGYNHAPDQGGRDAPVPVGRDVFQRGARRCQFCTNVDCVDSSRAACRVELGAKCRRDRSCPQYGADGSRSCVAEGRAEARR